MDIHQTDYPTILHKLYENEKELSDEIYLRQPLNGHWHEYTWKQAMTMARKVASFLHSQGLKRGDRVALISKNCAEWFITDFAILMAGMVTVPLYAAQHADTVNYILTHSDAKLIFIGKLDNWETMEPGVPEGLTRANFAYDTSYKADFQWQQIMSDYPAMTENFYPELSDMMTIIYTSGTTGRPKGVVISFARQAEAAELLVIDVESFTLPTHIHLFSYLPLAHVAERLAVQTLSVYTNADVSFVESIKTFANNLREVKPTIFFAVPRIWNIFRLGILEKLPQHKLDTLLKIPLLSSLIKWKIRKALGLNKSVFNISGAAPISPETLFWFKKIGIDIYEGYGQTENFAHATLNKPSGMKIGSVGMPRAGVEVKTGENSELLIKSPATMDGYYKEPEKTKAAIDSEGYLHTGDMATIDKDGFVFIVGRTKEQFKTEKGEYITPVPIENRFANSEYIEQICLMGAGLKQPILIVNLSEIGQKLKPEAITQAIQKHLEEVNENLTTHERIGHILITREPWSIENELLTPTQKVKRYVLEEKYSDKLKDVVQSEQKVVWEE